MRIKKFLKKAFSDMKANLKAQHEVDKAEFAAAKAEAKANFAKAKMMGNHEVRKKMMKSNCEKRIFEANKRKAEAETRIKNINKNK